MPDALRPAVFLDRDGTLVEDPGYLHEVEKVRLLPAAGPAVARFNQAGYAVVVVSNQSGIARGMFTEAAFHAVQARLGELLAEHQARIDAVYFCPHHPDVTGPCACRKPGTHLFELAARDLGLDPRRSWFVGDRMHDIRPATTLGGRGILVLTGRGTAEAENALRAGFSTVPDLAAAAALVLRDLPSHV
jgi:D-glycero-D-manno-heptose 1,7-bisphosphate phosphatase